MAIKERRQLILLAGRLAASRVPVREGFATAVMDALEAVGYRGFVTFEYFHPYQHYPEALIYQTSDSLDRILGRKA